MENVGQHLLFVIGQNPRGRAKLRYISKKVSSGANYTRNLTWSWGAKHNDFTYNKTFHKTFLITEKVEQLLLFVIGQIQGGDLPYFIRCFFSKVPNSLSNIHSYTDGVGCHERCWPAHQEQGGLGFSVLA